MMRSRLGPMRASLAGPENLNSPASAGRQTGRALQARRLRLWTADPHCKRCGKLVEFNAIPYRGFELDHRIPLFLKGPDTDENCDVLCIPDCHEAKTAEDLKRRRARPRMVPGDDGWPVRRRP